MYARQRGAGVGWLLAVLVVLFLGLDYMRRRRRARELFQATRKRVKQVNVAAVIDRELEDELWREQLFARVPAHTRYYDERRYELVWSFIPATLRDAHFLDAGCGDGYVLQETKERFLAQFETFTGVDISPYKATRTHERLGAQASIGAANVEQLPFRAGSFDVILCTEVLEHLLNVRPGIAELARICRPGGRVIFSTPSKQSMFFSFANPFTWLEAIAGLFRPELLPPFHDLERPEDPNSVVHRAFTIQELQQELKAFQTVTIVSTNFRLPGPFYRVLQSRAMLARIEVFLSQIPVINLLGETLIVCAVKAKT